MPRLLLSVVVGAPLIAACATASLNPSAKHIISAQTPPVGSCQNLGSVIGKGGGYFVGDYVPNEKLVQYAMNDALNRAAALGATHIQMGPPQLAGAYSSSATVVAVAYNCGAVTSDRR